MWSLAGGFEVVLDEVPGFEVWEPSARTTSRLGDELVDALLSTSTVVVVGSRTAAGKGLNRNVWKTNFAVPVFA